MSVKILEYQLLALLVAPSLKILVGSNLLLVVDAPYSPSNRGIGDQQLLAVLNSVARAIIAGDFDALR